MEDAQQREWRLRAEESSKRLAVMMAEVAAEGAAEKAALGAKVTASSSTSVLESLWYGTTVRLRPDQIQDYLIAIMAVAAVDTIDRSEKQWLLDRTLLLGLTPQQCKTLFASDLHPSKVEPVIETLVQGSGPDMQMQRLLFYDALTMATQDVFSLDEHLRAIRVAEVLKLAESEREAIEGVVRQEERLRRRKQALFSMPSETGSFVAKDASFSQAGSFKDASFSQASSFKDVTFIDRSSSSNGVHEGGLGGWFAIFTGGGPDSAPEPYNEQELASRPRRHAFHRLTYGTPVPLVEQRNEHYVASLLAVASAEGKVSRAERAWLQDRCTVLELGQELFSQFFDAISPDGTLRTTAFHEPEAHGDSVARAVLYDAVSMASQHGLMSEVKRERSRRVAAQLGLSADLCAEVFDIVATESELRQAKGRLFSTKSLDA